jgi:hypothetical protein
MAGSYAYDGTLLDVVGQGVAVDGDWFELLSSGSSERRLSNVQFNVSMPAGTGTWVLEGRNGPNDSPIQLDTGTAAKTASYPRMAQMRFRWTAATGLTARGSVNAVLKDVTYTPFFTDVGPWRGGAPGYWPDPNGVVDSFNRADSVTSLGNADSGQAWQALIGTWGISSNQAYLQTDTVPNEAIAVVDSGKSDCTVTAKMAVAVDGWRLTWRAADGANHFMLLRFGGSINVYRKQAGTFNQIGSAVVVPANGDVLSVVLSGTSHVVKLNGATIVSVTDAFQATATKHGIGNSAVNGARFDDFSVT